MNIERIDTLVVGAGQAGVAMSEHLGTLGVPHLVLERARIAERWRTQRWDSLVANGPAWHDRFPNLSFDDLAPEVFATKERIADYFVAYAQRIGAPIRTGVEVLKVERNAGRRGFRVETSAGLIEAERVVAATGPFQRPIIPPLVGPDQGIVQIHSADYRNPAQLPPGAVLVVGSGSSGVQIADELQRAGRRVYLSVGPHERPPRRYRNRDFVWWLGVLGDWDAPTPRADAGHVTIAVSGARGGETVDFRRLAHQGITLLGLTQSCTAGVVGFADDLAANITRGDASYFSLLDRADDYVRRNGLDLPEEPDARRQLADPACLVEPLRELDLAGAGVSAIVWATGFGLDYGWLKVDAIDDRGRPRHRQGIADEPGIYFIGLPYLSRRGSSFIWGVWHDAKFIADHIATQRKYAHDDDAVRGAAAAPAAHPLEV